jgi:membrane protein DedA with SNARE-associated domain/rhodanese-related sulfurtransferase
MRIGAAVVALVAGVALGDFIWYMLGRRGGSPILKRVCRRALEPDTCVRKTQNWFGRHGARALLFAKMIPGVSTVALPLAGAFGMRPRRFVLYDLAGVLFWTCVYVAAGYLMTRHLTSVSGVISRTPVAAVAAVVALLIAYGAWKYARRQRIRRESRIERASPDELRRKLDSGGDVAVVDLRHPIEFERDPFTIPRALYIPAEQLPARHQEIARDREVIVYCTCPGEITSARWALWLRRVGISARPLDGGFTAWRASGQPVTFVGPAVSPSAWVLNAA